MISELLGTPLPEWAVEVVRCQHILLGYWVVSPSWTDFPS